ncbi:MAG: FAD-dependent oxidoreductase [Gulosibacter sp.]|uniref:FAD-dependent oxidoreductase n=1 Tax=Gulosibacter sp. TaxID=2817531 RepID=UPI003F8E8AB3
MKVAVIGLGAIGAQVLWALSKRAGIEVHGFESGYIGHPFAGAGGESRLFRNLELTTEGYMPLVLRAGQLWDELETISGRKMRDKSGALLIGRQGDSQLGHAAQMASKWDLDHQSFEATELRERFPQFNIRNDQMGIWDSTAGVIYPERSIVAAVQEAVRSGATVNEFSAISSIEEDSSGARIISQSGARQTFDRVVVACGGWTTKVIPGLSDWIVTRRLTSAWFVGKADGYLTRLPPFMQVAPSYCYGIPTRGGELVKLGLGFNDHLPTGDPDEVPRHLDHREAGEQRKKFSWIVRDFLPGIDPNPVRMNTYVESYTRSMHEYLALAPEHKNTIVLGGFSGHGFKIAPAVGQIGADLVVDGTTDFDLSFLRNVEPVFDITNANTGETTFNAIVASSGGK